MENGPPLPIRYVLPNHMMLQIAEALPREQQGILACCNPIPPLVKQQLNELHSIILRATESSLKELEILELQQKAQAQRIVHNQIDLNSLIHCPHDIHHLEDKKVQSANQSGNAENLLPIITERPLSSSSPSLLKKKPILSALFDKVHEKVKSNNCTEKIPEKVVDLIKSLISPFERYKVTEQITPKDSGAKKVSTEENNEPSKQFVVPTGNSTINEEAVEVLDETLGPDIPQKESAPFRKGKKNKKRKAIPDISLTPDFNLHPPSKKSRTPEVVTIVDDDDDFKPYDYSQSDYSGFTRKNKANENKEKRNNEQLKGYFGKKMRNLKQGTFGNGSGNERSPRWPKNK
ncbi:exosome component 10 [Trichonephila clavipes]|nr:exosome component 10 [Trichonephila clavipes]